MNRNCVRAPMIADGPRWSKRKKAGDPGGMVRVPTPPAPPPGSAGADQESRRDARGEQSSPTPVPSDEGTPHINDDRTKHVPWKDLGAKHVRRRRGRQAIR
eukprot:524067-Pyramimonas_sp.AAC.1